MKVNMGKTCLFEDEKMAVLVWLKKLEALCRKGDCQWAKWLLFLRVRGREHEASFFISRSNLSKQMVHTSKLNVHEMDEIIHTVDDIAEGGGELVALATLLYESAPIQEFLCTGSVSSNCTSSSQCTLENLKPGLEKFPTLWRALLSVCFGTASIGVSTSSSSLFGKSAFSEYFRCRGSMSSSAGGDTSLVQMLPCWFPKFIRRLVRLFAQVPLRWQSLSSALSFGAFILYRENNYVFNGNTDGTNPINWEAAIQKSVEKELYSSIEGYHLVGLRWDFLKSSERPRLVSKADNSLNFEDRMSFITLVYQKASFQWIPSKAES